MSGLGVAWSRRNLETTKRMLATEKNWTPEDRKYFEDVVAMHEKFLAYIAAHPVDESLVKKYRPYGSSKSEAENNRTSNH